MVYPQHVSVNLDLLRLRNTLAAEAGGALVLILSCLHNFLLFASEVKAGASAFGAAWSISGSGKGSRAHH